MYACDVVCARVHILYACVTHVYCMCVYYVCVLYVCVTCVHVHDMSN